MVYEDHHDYRRKDIDAIEHLCRNKDLDLILTTEKDAVKLARFGFTVKGRPIFVLGITLDIIKGREDLVARLRSLYTGKRP
jgi:tetraacyldisaccharide 4'-kinase